MLSCAFESVQFLAMRITVRRLLMRATHVYHRVEVEASVEAAGARKVEGSLLGFPVVVLGEVDSRAAGRDSCGLHQRVVHTAAKGADDEEAQVEDSEAAAPVEAGNEKTAVTDSEPAEDHARSVPEVPVVDSGVEKLVEVDIPDGASRVAGEMARAVVGSPSRDRSYGVPLGQQEIGAAVEEAYHPCS